MNAEPGFFQEVFAYMKNILPENRDCNLIFDAMAIRKQIIFDSSSDRFMGYCDFGNFQVEPDETPATEALVFMLSSQREMEVAIGYFLQAKSSATVQAGLVKTVYVVWDMKLV